MLPTGDLLPSGPLRSVFLYAEHANVPSAMERDGRLYRFLHDHLGSVRLVIDPTRAPLLNNWTTTSGARSSRTPPPASSFPGTAQKTRQNASCLAAERQAISVVREILQKRMPLPIFNVNRSMSRANAQDLKANSIQGDVNVIYANIKCGDLVKLIGLPDWLIHDLPENEQSEMLTFIGQCAVVREIDSYGYIWVGFGGVKESEDSSRYSGHTFGVPIEFIELI